MTNHYELLYIVSIKHTGDDLTKAVELVTALLKDNGCKITHDEVIGKQKLAYPIDKVHQGTYVVAEFDGPRESIKELEKQLTLMKEILRFLIIKKRIKTADDIAHEQRIQDKLLKEKQDELTSLDSESPKLEAESEKAEVEAPVVSAKTEDIIGETETNTKKDEVKVDVPVVKEKVADVPVEPVVEPIKEEKEEMASTKPAVKAADATEIKEKKEKSKVSLEDLDKKLDEILTDDIL